MYRQLGQNGRLGNQMFQIAATFGYMCNNYCHKVLLPPWQYDELFPNVMAQAERLTDDIAHTHTFVEPKFHYTPIENSPEIIPPVTNGREIPVLNLHGYFQSEKYFKHCEEFVRTTLFAFGSEIKKKCENFIHEVHITHPGHKLVAMHMRFGDYVGNPYYADLQANEYYRRAIHAITDQVDDDVLFLLFSDDNDKAIAACEEIESTHGELPFLCIAKLSDAEDMCLQSLCDHHIIANSSFSWWSSYLSQAHNKIVVAPNYWFGESVPLETKDLYRKEMILR